MDIHKSNTDKNLSENLGKYYNFRNLFTIKMSSLISNSQIEKLILEKNNLSKFNQEKSKIKDNQISYFKKKYYYNFVEAFYITILNPVLYYNVYSLMLKDYVGFKDYYIELFRHFYLNNFISNNKKLNIKSNIHKIEYFEFSKAYSSIGKSISFHFFNLKSNLFNLVLHAFSKILIAKSIKYNVDKQSKISCYIDYNKYYFLSLFFTPIFFLFNTLSIRNVFLDKINNTSINKFDKEYFKLKLINSIYYKNIFIYGLVDYFLVFYIQCLFYCKYFNYSHILYSQEINNTCNVEITNLYKNYIDNSKSLKFINSYFIKNENNINTDKALNNTYDNNDLKNYLLTSMLTSKNESLKFVFINGVFAALYSPIEACLRYNAFSNLIEKKQIKQPNVKSFIINTLKLVNLKGVFIQNFIKIYIINNITLMIIKIK